MQQPSNEDEVIKRLMEAGATDEEIVQILRERKSTVPAAPAFVSVSTPAPAPSKKKLSLFGGAPVMSDARERPMGDIAGEALSNVGNVAKAFGSGVGTSLKRTAGLAASSVSGLPVAAGIFKATGQDFTRLRQAEPAKIDESRKTASIEKGAQVAGQMLGSLPVYGGIGAGVRAASQSLATRVSDPVLKSFLTRSVQGSFWKSAAASAPANVVEGVLADAALYPEDMREPEGILRSAALSLGGTIFDGLAGSRAIEAAIKDAATPAQVNKVIDLLAEVTPQGPVSKLPQYEGKLVPYSRWIPDAASVSAKRVDDLIDGPMPSAAELAMNRTTRYFRELADERLLEISKKNLSGQPVAEAGETSIFGPAGKVRSIVQTEPTPDDRILAASLQNAIDRAAESLKPLAQVRRGSGRAIDNLSFIEADASKSLLTFEELDELSKHLSLYFKRGKKDLTPKQKFIVEVQDRLSAAAKKGYENMSVKEILDLEDSLLAMSRRLDEQGFDLPAKRFIRDVKDPRPATPAKTGEVKIEEPEIQKPRRFNEDQGRFLGAGETLDDIRQADEAEFFKRLAAGDMPPRVSISPARNLDDLSKELPTNVVDLLKEANIEYDPQRPVGPQPTLRQFFQDRNIPVRELNNPAYDMLNNLGASRRAAENAVSRRGGLLLPKMQDGKWLGDSEIVDAMPMLEIQRAAGKRLVELEAYLKALRTLADESINTGMTPEAARKIVDLYSNDQTIQQLAAEYKKNMDFMVDYMVRLRRLSPDQGDKFKKMAYAPLGRIFNKPKGSNFLSFRLGSARKSAPIFEQSVEMMYAVIERTQRNYAWLTLVDQLKQDPIKMADHMSLAGSVNPAVFEEQIKELVANGVPEKDAADWVKAMYSGTFDKSDGGLIVFDNGIASKYYVSDALSLAVKANSPIELNLLQRVMMGLSIPMRESVALGLDLSMIGPISDAVTAAARDQEFNPFLDPIRGFWSSLIRDENYMKSVAAGRGFGARLRPDANILRVKPTKVNPLTAAVKVIPNAVSAANNLIRPLSDASRMGLYLSQIRQGATPQQAATFANNAIGNWNIIGAKMRSWSMITEFGNVGIQSGVTAAKAVKEISKNPKLAAKAAIVGFGSLTAPTLYLLSAYKDDDELNAMRRADNYDYWYWRDESGEPQKMRKPGWWLVPVFSSSVEAAWDGMDSEARNRLAKSLMNSLTFNPVPISIQTALGLLNNDTSPLNPFGNIPIVPGGQQDVSPEVQGSLQNSELAMGIRDAVGISPFKTDFFIRQALGSDLSSLLVIATGGTVGTKNRLPVLGRYSVSPRAPTEGSMLFYEDLKNARAADRTIKEFMLKDDEAGLNKYLEKNKKYVGLYDKLVGPSQELAKLNMLLRMISADTTMSKESKRNFEQEYRGLMNEFFREYATVRKEMLKEPQ